MVDGLITYYSADPSMQIANLILNGLKPQPTKQIDQQNATKDTHSDKAFDAHPFAVPLVWGHQNNGRQREQCKTHC